jgi:hypothetical protein
MSHLLSQCTSAACQQRAGSGYNPAASRLGGWPFASARPLRRKRGREARSAPAARPGGNRQAGRPRMRSAAPRTAMPLIPGPALRRYEGGLPPERLKRLRADLSCGLTSIWNRIPGTNPRGAEPARGPPRRGRTGPRFPGTRLAAAPIPVVGKDPGPRDVTPAIRTPHQPFGASSLAAFAPRTTASLRPGRRRPNPRSPMPPCNQTPPEAPLAGRDGDKRAQRENIVKGQPSSASPTPSSSAAAPAATRGPFARPGILGSPLTLRPRMTRGGRRARAYISPASAQTASVGVVGELRQRLRFSMRSTG